MNAQANNNDFSHSKYVILLAMLSATILMAAFVLSGKVITIGSHLATAAALILPAWFLLNDVITEVYGFAFAKKLFWFTMLCLFVFCLLTASLIHLNSPSNWTGNQSYQLVLGKMIYYFFIGFIAFIVSGLVNIYLVSKYKVLTNGRYFWLRSLGASTIGEALYSAIASLTVFGLAFFSPIPGASFAKAINVMITVYLIKVMYTIAFSWIAYILAIILKKAENIDVYAKASNFNPFKF